MEAKTDIVGIQGLGLPRRLKGELSRLRKRGMKEPNVGDLDNLTKLAALLAPNGTPNQQVEALLIRAIEAGYGTGSKMYEVVRLSFGLDDLTRDAGVKERHEAAWKCYGENSFTNFTTHVTPKIHERLAGQIAEFYEEHRAASEVEAEAEEAPALSESVVREGEPSPAPKGSGIAARAKTLLGRLSRRLRIVVAFALAFIVVATIYFSGVFGSSSSTGSVPPPGTVIDAQTGEIAMYVTKQPPRQFAQLERGSIFRACNVATETPCTYPGHHLIPAHVGNVINFGIKLHNPNSEPLPYASFLVAHQYGLLAQLEMTWPGDSSAARTDPTYAIQQRELREAESVELVLPKDFNGYEGLAYIPGSTVLKGSHKNVIAQLPDGIMENGIALANIGPPASCFDCDKQYIRYIFFKARVGGTRYP